MSFHSPWILLGLLVLPVLAVMYAGAQGTRRRQAAAFAAPRMQPAIVHRRPGWRRHAPMALFALALAVLLVSLARPERTVAVEVERASVMLTTDQSGSMAASDVPPNRLAAARSAADGFLNAVPSKVRVGAVAFNQAAAILQRPTTDRAAVRQKLATLVPSGGTATGEALFAALRAIQAEPRGADNKPPPAAILLISDGKSVKGRTPQEAAREAAKLKVPIYTVALGTLDGTIQTDKGGRTVTEQVPPDVEAMRQVAEISGGRTFDVSDTDALRTIYERLGSQLGTEDQKQEVTSSFAGGALVLLLLGSGLSLHWFRRPV